MSKTGSFEKLSEVLSDFLKYDFQEDFISFTDLSFPAQREAQCRFINFLECLMDVDVYYFFFEDSETSRF